MSRVSPVKSIRTGSKMVPVLYRAEQDQTKRYFPTGNYAEGLNLRTVPGSGACGKVITNLAPVG